MELCKTIRELREIEVGVQIKEANCRKTLTRAYQEAIANNTKLLPTVLGKEGEALDIEERALVSLIEDRNEDIRERISYTEPVSRSMLNKRFQEELCTVSNDLRRRSEAVVSERDRLRKQVKVLKVDVTRLTRRLSVFLPDEHGRIKSEP